LQIGFEVVDEIARVHGFSFSKKLSHKAQVAQGYINNTPVLLCKPMAFMNVSGESVAPIARQHGFDLGQVGSEHIGMTLQAVHFTWPFWFGMQILVIYDDLDSDFGAVKLKQKGGHGGHNGMRSIIQWLGNTHDFPRLKIGIGRPTNGMPIASYVLSRFTKDEMEERPFIVQEAVSAINTICDLGLDIALSGKRVWHLLTVQMCLQAHRKLGEEAYCCMKACCSIAMKYCHVAVNSLLRHNRARYRTKYTYVLMN
jgi:peptidyl-tRNA hydrolase, PTH1 family